MHGQQFRQEDCLWLLVRVSEHFGVPFSEGDARRLAGGWCNAVSSSQLEHALADLGVAAAPGGLPACPAGRRNGQAPFVAMLRSEEVCPLTQNIVEELIPVLVIASDEHSVSVTAAGDGEPLVLDRSSFLAMASADVFTLSPARARRAPRGAERQSRRLAANDPMFTRADSSRRGVQIA